MKGFEDGPLITCGATEVLRMTLAVPAEVGVLEMTPLFIYTSPPNPRIIMSKIPRTKLFI